MVYKTYKNDLEWLKYSLLSVKKFVTNFKEIVVYCENSAVEECTKILENSTLPCRIIPVTYDFHGYIKQMIVKIESYKDIQTKYICFVDSDNIFTNPLNCIDLVKGEKIEWIYITDSMAEFKDDAVWKIWKRAYEDMTKTIQDKCFMANGFPFIFTRSSLEEASNKFISMHGVDYSEFCKKKLSDLHMEKNAKIVNSFFTLATVFTELEWIGFFCFTYSSDYNFVLKHNQETKHFIKQYWSHSGVTEQIQNEILSILN